MLNYKCKMQNTRKPVGYRRGLLRTERPNPSPRASRRRAHIKFIMHIYNAYL